MKLKSKLSLAILLSFIFFFSCSGPSSLYNFDTPLTTDLAKSQTTELKVGIPKGWFSAEDNKEGKIDLWLVENDYNANVSFIRINPDEETLKKSGKNVLKKIEEFSRLNNKLAHIDKYIDLLKNEEFELNGRKFLAYQFAGSKNLYRVVVFKYKDFFYECIASIKPGQSKEDHENIYSVQNSVLYSIK